MAVPELNAISTKLNELTGLNKTFPNQISIDALENIYKAANNLSKPGESSGHFMNAIKGKINEITDGAGGDRGRGQSRWLSRRGSPDRLALLGWL